MERIMKKSFLLIILLLSSYNMQADIEESLNQENRNIYSELLKNINRTRTSSDYESALRAYISFGHEHNYPILAPSFSDVTKSTAGTNRSPFPSHAQILRGKEPISTPTNQPKTPLYPATQPYKPSLLDRLKATINPYLSSNKSK
jgi:hypothetical protein